MQRICCTWVCYLVRATGCRCERSPAMPRRPGARRPAAHDLDVAIAEYRDAVIVRQEQRARDSSLNRRASGLGTDLAVSRQNRYDTLGPSVPLLGNAGAAISCQLSPPLRERCSFTPKCPRASAAYSAPSRGSCSSIEIGSPRKRVPAIAHAPRVRRSSNRPFFVPTSERSLMTAVLSSKDARRSNTNRPNDRFSPNRPSI